MLIFEEDNGRVPLVGLIIKQNNRVCRIDFINIREIVKKFESTRATGVLNVKLSIFKTVLVIILLLHFIIDFITKIIQY